MNGMAKQLSPNPNLYNDSHLTLYTTMLAVIMSSVECVYACVLVLVLEFELVKVPQIEEPNILQHIPKHTHKQ